MIDLTPLEVRKKKGDFRRTMRGYDVQSVDDFLDLVADRLEQLVRENLSLQDRTTSNESQIGDYRERERALTEALVTAQEMREEMRRQMEREVELKRREAEADAEEIRTSAAQMREREEENVRRLRARQTQFVQSYRGFLERELAELAVIIETLDSSTMGHSERPAGTTPKKRSKRAEPAPVSADELEPPFEREPNPEWLEPDEELVDLTKHFSTAPMPEPMPLPEPTPLPTPMPAPPPAPTRASAPNSATAPTPKAAPVAKPAAAPIAAAAPTVAPAPKPAVPKAAAGPTPVAAAAPSAAPASTTAPVPPHLGHSQSPSQPQASQSPSLELDFAGQPIDVAEEELPELELNDEVTEDDGDGEDPDGWVSTLLEGKGD